MAYQSLYRRYRSGSFTELRGQEHVVRALRNAVREDRVGHAYLFSGPRGTGKTSTARILAKALNCENLSPEGEPCGECESCRAIETGTSFDLHELDAASNNGVEAVRDLISRAGIGSPGRRKVYILDEVHMLSAGASNALLKTLEEPPPQVVFVLATTDPHKVLPTIRSRTQHLEFGLLPADVLEAHVRWVVSDAELDVDDEGIAYAMRQGGGSARDTLSALDQVVAAGGVPSGSSSVDGVVEAICEDDTAAAVVAVALALSAGREPRPLAEDLLARLRDIFLASVGGPLDHLTDTDRERAVEQSGRLGRATITRALELVGEAIADMRHVGDPRIPLEVALVRLTRPEVDTSLAALADRVSRLERNGVAAAPAVEAASAPAPAPAPKAPARAPVAPAPSAPAPPKAPAPKAPVPKAPVADAAAIEAEAEPTPEPAPVPAPTPEPEPEPAPAARPAPPSGGGLPGIGELESAWASSVLPSLSGKARARFNAGTFTGVDSEAEFALPNPIHRDRCEELRSEVEAALASHFGRPVPLRLVVGGEVAAPAGPRRDDEAPSPPPAQPARDSARPERPRAEAPPPAEPEPDPFDDADDHIDLDEVAELEDADVATSSVDRLTELFPGAEVVEE